MSKTSTGTDSPIQAERKGLFKRVRGYFDRHREPPSSFASVNRKGLFGKEKNPVRATPRHTLPWPTLLFGNFYVHLGSTDSTKQRGWWTPFGRMTWSRAPWNPFKLRREITAGHKLRKGKVERASDQAPNETSKQSRQTQDDQAAEQSPERGEPTEQSRSSGRHTTVQNPQRAASPTEQTVPEIPSSEAAPAAAPPGPDAAGAAVRTETGELPPPTVRSSPEL